jgi:hypothetical protein
MMQLLNSFTEKIHKNTINKIIYVRFRSTSNPQIHVRFLRHRHMYLRSQIYYRNTKFTFQHAFIIIIYIYKYDTLRSASTPQIGTHCKNTINKIIYVRFRSTSNPQIHVRFLRHRHMYLRSQIYGHSSLSQIDFK